MADDVNVCQVFTTLNAICIVCSCSTSYALSSCMTASKCMPPEGPEPFVNVARQSPVLITCARTLH